MTFCSRPKYNDNPPWVRIYTNPWLLYQTRRFKEFWGVPIEHLIRVWNADRGRLLLWTPGPISFGSCICSSCLDQRHLIWDILQACDIIPGLDIMIIFDISPNIGFNLASAMGVAFPQGTVTPRHLVPSNLGLAWDQFFSRNCRYFLRTMLFENSSVLSDSHIFYNVWIQLHFSVLQDLSTSCYRVVLKINIALTLF